MPDALPGSVPRALQALASEAPNVEVSLETGATHQLIQSVRDEQLDAVVVGLPAPAKGLQPVHEQRTAAPPFHRWRPAMNRTPLSGTAKHFFRSALSSHRWGVETL